MENNRKETKKLVDLAQAQMKIIDFLETDYSYTELMAATAKAQAQVFNIISMVNPDERDMCLVDEISEFFFYTIHAFELLKPFSKTQMSSLL